MQPKDYVIRGLKHGYRILSRKTFLNPECDCDRQSANDKIYNLLSSGKPCMIARFGTTEINCINNYLCVHSPEPYLKKCWNYITDKTHTPWWNKDHFHTMSIYSGIFPETQDTAERFSERYLQDIPQIDILACHQYYEKYMPLKKNVQHIQILTLDPFYVELPWTRILKNKKVLIVHPFERTIREQYKKRCNLFKNPNILPDFKLITYKAVQTIAGNNSQFNSWFEALKYMEDEISRLDFDIAILGCGAYGLPLAAFIKKIGKQAIHMGGSTQLLFGILGKRWTEQFKGKTWNYLPGVELNLDYSDLFNDNWSYPLPEDTPKDKEKVEDSCYWK